jgi:4-amino-4-deoxy-L-arabinose transferase-like glycosyltransferase
MRQKSFAPVLALGLTLAAAALLRFWALGHGVPFALGVDEPEVMERAIRMMKTGDLNPHFYDYPAFYMYVQMAVATLRFVLGATRGEWSSLAQASTADFYVWGRAVTAALGTLNVWLLYRAGLRWDRATAILAAALFAVMPLHVRESHFVLTDVPTTFFVTLTLLLSLRAYEQPRLRTFVLAGAAAGLAGATKYNGILAMAMPAIACAGAPRASRPKAALFGSMLAAAVLAFLLAAPYTLLDLPNFLNSFAQLSSEYHATPQVAHLVTVTALKNMRNALDWRGAWLPVLPVGPGSLLAIAGLVFGVWQMAAARGRRPIWALGTVFPLLYFWFISGQAIHFARYLLPLVPFVSLLTAAVVVQLVARLARAPLSNAMRTAFGAALLLVAIVPPLGTAISFDANQSKVWTLEEAYDWIRQSLPRGTSVRLEGHALLLPPDYRPTYSRELRFDDIGADAANGVDYLVASSEEYGQYIDHPGQHPVEYAAYQRVFAQTHEVARFTPSSDHPGPEIRILKVPR